MKHRNYSFKFCQYVMMGFLFTIALGNSYVQSQCLVHHYAFDGTVKDSASSQNHLVNYGATFTDGRLGKKNGAIHLDSGQYLTGNSDSLPHSSSSRTVSIWLYLEVNPDSDVPIVWGKNGPAEAYGITLGTNLDFKGEKAMRHFAWGKTHDHGFKLDYPVNEWFHLATTYDGDTAKTYLNGSMVAAMARRWDTQKRFFMIGQNLNTMATDYYQGAIDELRVYKCALSAREIEKLAERKTVSISEQNQPFLLFPNPASSMLNLEVPQNLHGQISIVDQRGVAVYQITGKINRTIDVSHLSTGVYHVQVATNSAIWSRRWVKM